MNSIDKITITVDGKKLELSPEEFIKRLDNGTLKVVSFNHESNRQFKEFVELVRARASRT